MHTSVRKWGNSASVRIPASMMQAAHLNLNQVLEIREENGCLIIQPLQKQYFTLEELVDGITPKNQHAAVDTGTAVGKEIW